MGTDVLVSPTFTDQQRETIDKLCGQFDKLIDDPATRTTPVSPEALQKIGSLLSSETFFYSEDLVGQLETAKDDEQPLRLIFTDASTLSLPWELLPGDHWRYCRRCLIKSYLFRFGAKMDRL